MNDEKENQEKFSYERTNQYSSYGKVLGHYQATSVLENCANRGSLLDLACNDGFITEILCSHFNHVIGVDASSIHLDNARKRLPNVLFIESLLEDLEINEKFDCVTMLNILEHVQDPQLALIKASAFLNDEGVLIIQVPNSEAVNRKIAVLMGTLTTLDELSPWDIDIAGHRRNYDLNMLIGDVKSSGLEIVKTGGIFYKMMSMAQIDWFLENGLWDSGFGWGRVGNEQKDWRSEFCKACYLYGKEYPTDCNVIYVMAKKDAKK